MFCEKCGTKNEDNAKFCEECGAVLEVKEMSYIGANNFSNSPQKPTFTAPSLNDDIPGITLKNTQPIKSERKPMSLKNKIILAVVGVLIILCGSLYSLGKIATSPEKIVEKYFENISSQKYTEAYEYMDIESNEFTTKDIFVKVMENRNGKKEADILNYTIKENLEQNPLMKKYTITYTQKGSSNTSTMNVTLMKQSSKKWLFYDDYKIAENGLIAKDYSITIPNGAEIYIDDIKVNENYAENSISMNLNTITEKTYIIPSIFVGTHKIKVSSPFSKDKIFDKNIENGGFIDVYSVDLTDTAKEEVSKVAEEFLDKVVTSAIDKKPLDDLKTYFSVNANMERIQENYDNLKEKGINDEGIGVKSITLNQFKSTANKEYQSESSYGVSVNYEYNYTALKENWFDETIEEYTPERSQNGSATVYFIYEDGKWMVSDFYINIYMYY